LSRGVDAAETDERGYSSSTPSQLAVTSGITEDCPGMYTAVHDRAGPTGAWESVEPGAAAGKEERDDTRVNQ